jgi:hypothetical protein
MSPGKWPSPPSRRFPKDQPDDDDGETDDDEKLPEVVLTITFRAGKNRQRNFRPPLRSGAISERFELSVFHSRSTFLPGETPTGVRSVSPGLRASRNLGAVTTGNRSKWDWKPVRSPSSQSSN